MRRREFVTLVGGAAAAWPLTARAQQPAIAVVGVLSPSSAERSADFLAALRTGLGETGFVEDQNLRIEYRFANFNSDRLPTLARELVDHRVGAILAIGVAAGMAAKDATSAIPVVFMTGFDPVELGLVSTLNRPTGNVTGVAVLSNTLEPKQLQLLHEVAPMAKLVGLVANPTNPGATTDTRVLQSAASISSLFRHWVYN